MKKSLIALAVSASLAAPAIAQNVSISGVLDVAGASISGTQTISNTQTITTGAGTSATSVINLIASEDLGGGMRATAKYGLDPRTLFNDNFLVSNNTGASGATTGALGNTATGLARDEAFVGLSGTFGNIRLGAPNAISLDGFLTSSLLGTGVGSGFRGAAGSLNDSFMNIRYDRAVRYDSPSVNGFSASVQYAPGQDLAKIDATTTTSGSRIALAVPNNRTVTEIGLRFAGGPVIAQGTFVQHAEQSNGTGWYAAGSTAGKTTVSMFDARFALSPTTNVGLGYHSGDQKAASNATNLPTDGYRISVSQDFGSWDLRAQYQRFSQTVSAGVTATPVTIGLRADYKLSKTAAVYAGYESYETDRAYTATAGTLTGKRTIGSLGIRKAF